MIICGRGEWNPPIRIGIVQDVFHENLKYFTIKFYSDNLKVPVPDIKSNPIQSKSISLLQDVPKKVPDMLKKKEHGPNLCNFSS